MLTLDWSGRPPHIEVCDRCGNNVLTIFRRVEGQPYNCPACRSITTRERARAAAKRKKERKQS